MNWIRFQKLVLVTFPTTWNISYHIDSWKFVDFFSLFFNTVQTFIIRWQESAFVRSDFQKSFPAQKCIARILWLFLKEICICLYFSGCWIVLPQQLNSSAWPHNWNYLSEFRGENGARVNDLRLSTNWTFTHFNQQNKRRSHISNSHFEVTTTAISLPNCYYRLLISRIIFRIQISWESNEFSCKNSLIKTVQAQPTHLLLESKSLHNVSVTYLKHTYYA